jgi:predicted CoA-binding protein
VNDWRVHVLDSEADIGALLARVHRIAVLGIKPESVAGQPAHDVPRYAQHAGFEIVPVPVYYPDATEILGHPVYRTVSAVPGPVDLVNVFRRAKDLPAHLPDLLRARPAAVWLQSGIRNDDFAAALAQAGIDVVQDRCLMVELARRGR